MEKDKPEREKTLDASDTECLEAVKRAEWEHCDDGWMTWSLAGFKRWLE